MEKNTRYHVDNIITAIIANHLNRKKYAKTFEAFAGESGLNVNSDLLSDSALASLLGVAEIHRLLCLEDPGFSVLDSLTHAVLNIQKLSPDALYSMATQHVRCVARDVKSVRFDVEDDLRGTCTIEQLTFDPQAPVCNLREDGKLLCAISHTDPVRVIFSALFTLDPSKCRSTADTFEDPRVFLLLSLDRRLVSSAM